MRLPPAAAQARQAPDTATDVVRRTQRMGARSGCARDDRRAAGRRRRAVRSRASGGAARRCRGRKRLAISSRSGFRLVAPAWPQFDDVLTRYAAAKAFASWSLYLGDGVEAAAATARIAACGPAHRVRASVPRRSAARSIASCCPTRSGRATCCSCTTPIPSSSLTHGVSWLHEALLLSRSSSQVASCTARPLPTT